MPYSKIHEYNGAPKLGWLTAAFVFWFPPKKDSLVSLCCCSSLSLGGPLVTAAAVAGPAHGAAAVGHSSCGQEDLFSDLLRLSYSDWLTACVRRT